MENIDFIYCSCSRTKKKKKKPFISCYESRSAGCWHFYKFYIPYAILIEAIFCENASLNFWSSILIYLFILLSVFISSFLTLLKRFLYTPINRASIHTKLRNTCMYSYIDDF